MAEVIANSPTPGVAAALTTLGAAITTTGATSLTASAAVTGNLLNGNFRIIIDTEIMLVTAGQSGTTWTITRGVEGSSAATHLNGASIYHVWTSAGVLAATMQPTAPMAASVIGQWYAGEASGPYSASINTSISLAVGTWIMGMPLTAQETITIDKLGVLVHTAGSGGAGALVRLGLFAAPSNSAPYDLTLGTTSYSLLQDGGTAPATSNATIETVTLGTPQVITAGSAFAVGVAIQGTAGNTILDCIAAGGMASSAWGTSSVWGGANLAVKATGITGAFSAVVPSAFFTAAVGGAGWYHRSA